MIFSETNTKIAPALAKAWGDMENPTHNTSVTVKMKSGGSYKFDYTDLGGVLDEAKKVFKDNGITVIQNAYTHHIENIKYVSIETMLLHSSGEYVKSLPLQIDANPSIQDMGGQITYMKRYSLSAMLGIATEKDDDANGSMGNEAIMNNKPNVASDKQIKLVENLIKDVAKKYDSTESKVVGKMKLHLQTSNDLNQLTKSEASKAIEYLQGAKDKPLEEQPQRLQREHA